ncbi:MAG: ribonuclease domain-containing protein [Thermomonas sp.]
MVGLAWRHGLPGTGNAPIAVPTAAAARSDGPALPAFLPAEARAAVALIQRGGPFPHAQDGSVFGNYEGHLPRQPRGWYHECTVPTPGVRNRGTRRIVTGGTPPREWYYTDDHYASFRRFDVP